MPTTQEALLGPTTTVGDSQIIEVITASCCWTDDHANDTNALLSDIFFGGGSNPICHNQQDTSSTNKHRRRGIPFFAVRCCNSTSILGVTLNCLPLGCLPLVFQVGHQGLNTSRQRR